MKYQYVVKGTENGEQREKLFEDGGDAIRFAETCGWDDVQTSSVKVEEPSSNTLHNRGADAAARYLETCGYEIAERGYSCKYGKTDIIAYEGDTLCFINVKVSSHESGLGLMFHDYSESQIDKMERTAMDYLVHHDERLDVPVRFDAVSVAVLGEQRAMLRHHVNCVNKGF